MKKMFAFTIVCSLTVWFTAIAIHTLHNVVVNVRAERDAARADGSTQSIQCFCNLPACLESSGGVQTCTSSLGCFAELVPVGTGPSSAVSAPPIPLALDEDAAANAVVDEEEQLRGQYGCLELSSTFHAHKNDACNTTLKSTVGEEFSSARRPESSVRSADAIPYYYCCVMSMCNEASHVAVAVAPPAEAGNELENLTDPVEGSVAPRHAADDDDLSSSTDYAIGSARDERNSLSKRSLEAAGRSAGFDTTDVPRVPDNVASNNSYLSPSIDDRVANSTRHTAAADSGLSLIGYVLGLARNETNSYLSKRPASEAGRSFNTTGTDVVGGGVPHNAASNYSSLVDYVVNLTRHHNAEETYNGSSNRTLANIIVAAAHLNNITRDLAGSAGVVEPTKPSAPKKFFLKLS